MNCADEFRLASLYSDGMVLKSIIDGRSYPYIWGYAEPGTMVEVTLVSPENEEIGFWHTGSNIHSYWGLKLAMANNYVGVGFTLKFSSMSLNGRYL